MRLNIFTPLFLLAFVSVSFSSVPTMTEQTSLKDITHIKNPEEKHVFYGVLTDFPHTYEIRAEEPFTLSATILVPDISTSKNIISGIIIKEKARGGVDEVARLRAQEAHWGPVRDVKSGDIYRLGPQFESQLDAGVYRVEVSTPDNVEKYVLRLGTTESDERVGYIQTVKNIIAIKLFFDKSPFRVLESKVVYAPLLIVLILSAFGGYLFMHARRKKRLQDVV